MRILVAAEPSIRQALRRIFAAAFHEVMCAEAATTEQAADLALRLRFEVIVLDLSLRGLAGMKALQRIHEVAPHVPIIVVTPTEDDQEAHQAFAAGALAYLGRESQPQDLVDAVRTVLNGKQYVGGSVGRVTGP